MRAQIVKLSNAGEEVMEDEFVLDEDRAMDMYEDYILNDPEMDDYVKEEYAAYASGEGEYGRKKRIGWLIKNGKISETSLKGKYTLYLYVQEEDDREIDEYYTESKMSVKVNQEKEGYLDIMCKCPICGETSVVTMPEEDFDIGVELYRNGALIQRAFPKLNADERELIKTGICDKCWKSTMGDDEDEYLTESGNDVETTKADVWRSIIMKRYAQSKEDLDKWGEIFDERLEAYVQARIAEHDAKKNV